MGAGKSTVGKRLAQALGVLFVDLDAEIERISGRAIKEIFASDGEPAFRTIEHEALCNLCQHSYCAVVATGGGIVVDPRNRQLMHKSGLVIHLQVEFADVTRRLAKDQTRPLLQQKDPASVRALMESRAEAYADADLIINTVEKSPVQIVSEIQEWLLK